MRTMTGMTPIRHTLRCANRVRITASTKNIAAPRDLAGVAVAQERHRVADRLSGRQNADASLFEADEHRKQDARKRSAGNQP